jgi:putative colanic acid biosynthesis glycosyltransferase
VKICQINCVYGVGSTGRIERDIHLALLASGQESVVLNPLKNQYTFDSSVRTFSNKFLSYASAIYRRGLGRQFDGALIQTTKLLRMLEQENPDVVHLHCINGNNINIYRLLEHLAYKQIKTVLTLHAEFMYTGGCGHAFDCEKWKTGCGKCPILKEATQSIFFDGTKRTWKKMKQCYEEFQTGQLFITAVSPWLLQRAQQSPLLSSFPMKTVMNCLDTEVFYRRDAVSLREELGLSTQEKVVFHATASFNPYENNLKGGKYILALAERLKDRNIRLIVAANYCNVKELPANVLFVGRIANAEKLAEYYSLAEVTVIVSCRETFSMVTAESLSCGTPVVGFQAGGPESIALSEYTEFVSYGDIEALVEACERWMNNTCDRQRIAETAKQLYSKDRILGEYLSVYKRLKK